MGLFAVALRRVYPDVLGLSADEARGHLAQALGKPNRKGSTPLDLAAADPANGLRVSAYLRSLREDDREAEEAERGGDADGFTQLEARLDDLLQELSLVARSSSRNKTA